MKDGCKYSPRCEDCPLDDCKQTTSYTASSKRYYERHKEEIKRKRRERYQRDKVRKAQEVLV